MAYLYEKENHHWVKQNRDGLFLVVSWVIKLGQG